MRLLSLLSLLALLLAVQAKHKQKEKKKDQSGLVLTESGELCHFPFHYARIMHHSCIRRGKQGPKAWCSLTKNYDRDQRWSYCMEGRNVKDHCEQNLCESGGVCESTLKSYNCVCREPFTGRYCQTDKCFDDQLLRYFEPREKWLHYSPPNLEECMCSEKGSICKAISGRECSDNPCLNGGRCMKAKTTTVCGCTQGHKGPHCEIRPSEACYTGNGTSYRGTAHVTMMGTPCLPWDSDIIQHEVTMFSHQQTKDYAIGSHPYCRNPGGDTQPWCFVLQEQRLSWEHCHIPRCNQSAASTSDPPVSETEPPTRGATSSPSKSDPTTSTEGPSDGSTRLPVNCGERFRKSPSLTPRIVGGLVALPASHPYIAALYIGNLFCGGALISSCWVLTAAHCLQHRPDVTELTVVLGQRLFNTTDMYTITFPVQKYILHEMYSEITFQHDIALVKLKAVGEACAEFSQFVQPVCLSQNFKVAGTGTQCEVAGWGHQHHGAEQYALYLQEAFIPIIPHTQCCSPNVHGNRILPGMLCAGFLEGGADACQGDSGGPLVCEVDGRIELNGIVSWGTGCGEENKPGVYTAVSSYIDWVKANIS
ncbi:coagulation factor XII isoform X1 [Ascaphus truei]|uniref:coagulation factor XII isoform X1 n=1 Tax=Ascaphus truei TaxID=8439 RepID=UPI003F5A6121